MQALRTRRLGLAAAAAVTVALLSTAAVAAKEGGIARLAAPLPRDAEPGSTITVNWSLSAPYDNAGNLRPFSAMGAYIKLIGLDVSEAVGTETPLGSGKYVADIVIPKGGIQAVEFGIAGTSTVNGVSRRSNMVFEFQGQLLQPAAPPAAQPNAGSNDGAATQPAGPTFNPLLAIGAAALVLAGIATLVTLRRRAAVV